MIYHASRLFDFQHKGQGLSHSGELSFFSPKVHELGIILFYNFMILHVLLNVSRTSL